MRTAGHDWMDFRMGKKRDMSDSTGGADGCINLNDPDNKGIAECLIAFDINTVYGKWCDKISLADFFIVIAESIMGQLAVDYDATNPFAKGSLAARFRDQLHLGRSTLEECPNNVGRMPNPEEGCQGLEKIFVNHIYKRIGKWRGWKATAAVSGAHTLGKAHVKNSGYNG